MRNKKIKKSVGYVEVEQFNFKFLFASIAAAALSAYFAKLACFFNYLMWDLDMYNTISDFYFVSAMMLTITSGIGSFILILCFFSYTKTVRLKVKGAKR